MSTPTLYSAIPRKARKAHRCCECRQEIPKGTKYIDVNGLWEDRFENFKLCECCDELFHKAVEMHDGMPEDGPCFQNLRAWLLDTDYYEVLGLPGGEEMPT